MGVHIYIEKKVKLMTFEPDLTLTRCSAIRRRVHAVERVHGAAAVPGGVVPCVSAVRQRQVRVHRGQRTGQRHHQPVR